MDTTATAPAPLLFSIDDAARLLGISPRHLRALAARGRLRTTRLGRRRLVHRDQLSRLATEGTGEGGAP